MSYVLTLVASSPDTRPVRNRHIEAAYKTLDHYEIMPTCAPVWLAESKAVDLGITEKPASAYMKMMRGELDQDGIDLFVSGVDKRRKRLLLADMDSTIVKGETLDELAEFAGLKDKVAEITARAMNGEIDFVPALKERVSLLEGLAKGALDETLARVELNPGAQKLVQVMRAHEATCVLVSGGFTFFTREIARQCAFDHHHGNTLEIEKGLLTGKVLEPVLDKHAKIELLRYYIQSQNLQEIEVCAIGDGANDLPMLQAAGLGIGYKAKESVAAGVDNVIVHGDLSAALYAQGYTGDHLA